MRLLADENFPAGAVRDLVARGHDVVWVASIAQGTSDSEVLSLARHEERVLLTFDKDFGELARDAALPSSCGVILIRVLAPVAGTRLIVDAICSRDDWVGHFSVIEPGRVRMRPLTT